MLFISHKTEDKAFATEVRQRALRQGYAETQIFLDSDPLSGIQAGTSWEDSLYASLKHTRAMVVVCSPQWLSSQWCFVELGYARAMSISLFPIIISPCQVGSTLGSTQTIDMTTAAAADPAGRDAAFDRLWRALEALHLGPHHHLPWPPPGQVDACPFPGLMYFEERHAPVFFGREQERAAVVALLQEMRRSGVPRLLMIEGGSGSGKSSLMRAGVLPWLRHPQERGNWHVLPTLRHGEFPNADITLFVRLAQVVAASFPPGAPHAPDWKTLRVEIEGEDVEKAGARFVEVVTDLSLALQASGGQGRAQPQGQGPTILISLDQCEEMLTPAAGEVAARFLAFLKALLSRSNGSLLVLGTLRADYSGVYERHPAALKVPFLSLYRLPLFPWDKVEDVIVKPAAKVNVVFDDDLLERLMKDAPNGDALPLLAFTLESLHRRFSNDGRITLEEYEVLGGMEGSIQKAIDDIMRGKTPDAMAALRLVFVKHLAQATEKAGEYVRLRALLEDVPAMAHPILEEFVQARLLVASEHSKGQVQMEVAHEAMFRCWAELKTWLEASADLLRWRRDVEHDRTADGPRWKGLRPAQLAIAKNWPQERGQELHDDEIGWIKQGLRRQNFQRGLIFAVCALISLLAVMFYRQKVDADKARVSANTATMRAQEAQTDAQNALKETQRQLEQSQFHEGKTWHARAKAARDKGDHYSALILAGRAIGFQGLGRQRAETPQFEKDYPLLLGGSMQNEGLEARRKKEFKSIQEFVRDLTPGLALRWTSPLTRHHRDRITSVKFSQDDTRLMTLGGKELKTWSMVDGARLMQTKLADQPTYMSSSSLGVDWVACAHEDCVNIFDSDTGLLRTSLPTGKRADLVSFSFDGARLAAQWEGKIHIWNVATGKEVMSFASNVETISAMVFSRNGRWLLGRSDGKSIMLWDLIAGKLHHKLEAHLDTVSAVDFMFEDRYVVSAAKAESGDDVSEVVVWDVQTSKEVKRIFEVTPGIYSIACSPKAWKIVAGCGDGGLRIWNEEDSGSGTAFIGHNSTVDGLAFSADGQRFASFSENEGVRAWSAVDAAPVFQPSGHLSYVRGVAYSPDGLQIASASDDHTVKLWDGAGGTEMMTLRGHEGPVSCLAYSPNGAYLASGSYDGTVKIWSLPAGKQVAKLELSSWKVERLSFSPDGQSLATASEQIVRVWDTKTFVETAEFMGKDESWRATAFSPSGMLLAGGGSRMAGVSRAEARLSPALIAAAAGGIFRGETPEMLYLPKAGLVSIWDVGSRKEVMKLPEQEQWCSDIVFSQDGSLLARVYDSRTIKVWDMKAGKERWTLQAKGGKIRSVQFSPDGSMLAGASIEGTIEVWETSKGVLITSVRAHAQEVTSLCFSPDGSRLVSGSADHVLKIWDVLRPSFESKLAWLSSEAWDASLGVVDSLTGDVLLAFEYEDEECHVGLSPDATFAAFKAPDGEVTLWDLVNGLEMTGETQARSVVDASHGEQWLQQPGQPRPGDFVISPLPVPPDLASDGGVAALLRADLLAVAENDVAVPRAASRSLKGEVPPLKLPPARVLSRPSQLVLTDATRPEVQMRALAGGANYWVARSLWEQFHASPQSAVSADGEIRRLYLIALMSAARNLQLMNAKTAAECVHELAQQMTPPMLTKVTVSLRLLSLMPVLLAHKDPEVRREGEQLMSWLKEHASERWKLGLKDRSGIAIRDVPPSSPAASIGLRIGDMLLTYNGITVWSPEHFIRLVEENKLTVPLEVDRQDEIMSFQAPSGALGMSIDIRENLGPPPPPLPPP